jgi:unsaturated rhamnogalacturonyl hydrolase
MSARYIRRALLAATLAAAVAAGTTVTAEALAATHPAPTTDWSVAVVTSTDRSGPTGIGGWSYPVGLFLYGQYLVYQRTQNPTTLTFIEQWANRFIDANGHINNSFSSLDATEPGIVYLALYQKTGLAKYRNAATQIEQRLEHSNYPRVDGALQHALARPHQLWADGTFMALPFLARYENQIGDHGTARTDAITNLLTYAKHLQRPDGMLWHAYDSSASQPWVVPGTNHSPETWCRADGWFAMSSVMVLDATPSGTPRRTQVLANLQHLAAAIRTHQDPASGRWFQVVDKGTQKGNWTETSCSSMFTYTISRAVQQGYLDASYKTVATRGYAGVLQRISNPANPQLVDICIGTNVGNYAYYIGRTKATNDLHGLGSFLIMNEQLRTT